MEPWWRRRTALVIAGIWLVVLVGAFLAAAAFPDDDPTTDDAAGAGALAAVVGAMLTVLYLGISRIRTRTQAVDVIGAIGLFVLGIGLSAAVGVEDAAIFAGGAFAGLFLWLRMRGRPRAHKLPPAPGRRCPSCAQVFRCNLAECPHCGVASEPWRWHSDAWWTRSRSGDWQWLDEAAGTWRWYADGSPSGPSSSTAEASEGTQTPPEAPQAG